eukprot:1593951-Pyramimonas_sp.AAC.1
MVFQRRTFRGDIGRGKPWIECSDTFERTTASHNFDLHTIRVEMGDAVHARVIRTSVAEFQSTIG